MTRATSDLAVSLVAPVGPPPKAPLRRAGGLGMSPRGGAASHQASASRRKDGLGLHRIGSHCNGGAALPSALKPERPLSRLLQMLPVSAHKLNKKTDGCIDMRHKIDTTNAASSMVMAKRSRRISMLILLRVIQVKKPLISIPGLSQLRSGQRHASRRLGASLICPRHPLAILFAALIDG